MRTRFALVVHARLKAHDSDGYAFLGKSWGIRSSPPPPSSKEAKVPCP